jgi:hypothetical protein
MVEGVLSMIGKSKLERGYLVWSRVVLIVLALKGQQWALKLCCCVVRGQGRDTHSKMDNEEEKPPLCCFVYPSKLPKEALFETVDFTRPLRVSRAKRDKRRVRSG